MNDHEQQEFLELVGPVIVIERAIRAATGLRASALMLPLSLGRGITACFGLPVVRGDRVALMYEKRRDAAPLPLHRTEAGYPRCATCDGGGCPDCTDPA